MFVIFVEWEAIDVGCAEGGCALYSSRVDEEGLWVALLDGGKELIDDCP